MTQPITGTPQYAGSFLANVHVFVVLGDKETPAMQVATIEAAAGNAVIALDAIRGDKGDQGQMVEPIKMRYDPNVNTAADLPTNLKLADRGRTYWVDDGQVWHWTGDRYIRRPMGSRGAPGPVPDTTFTIEQVGPDEQTTLTQSGTLARPQVHIRSASPRGPVGPPSTISLAQDFDNTRPAQDGQVVTWSDEKNKWQASDFAAKHPRLYSIPQLAFQPFTGPAQRQNIMTYQIEAQDYDWVPYVRGHLKAVGVSLSTDPFRIGAEVRLGDAMTGQLIGRGYGNISSWAVIDPHFSTGTDTATAVAPGNPVAVVPRGQVATINCNLFNDGVMGSYQFDPATGPQLSVLTIPVGD